MTTVPFRGRLEDLDEEFIRKLKAAYPYSYVEIQLNAPEKRRPERGAGLVRHRPARLSA
jgi:hypothetical protein